MIPEPFSFPIRLIEAWSEKAEPLCVVGTDVVDRFIRVEVVEREDGTRMHIDVACCRWALAEYDKLESKEDRNNFRHVWRAGSGGLHPGLTVLSDEHLRAVTASQIIWPDHFTVGAEANELAALQVTAAREGKQ